VEIEHHNLSHFVADSFASKYVDLGPGSQVLQFATFSFDAAVLEWAQYLAVGVTLCFVDTPKALVEDYLVDVIDTNEVMFMHVTPSVLVTLPTSHTLPSLRQY
jgi:tenuazonic acid synthetase